MPIGATYYTIRIYAGCDGPGGTAKAYEHNMRQAIKICMDRKNIVKRAKIKLKNV